MAQIVRSSENNFEYLEGPFVVCEITSGDYRLECELKGHHTSVLPDSTIYTYAKNRCLDLRSRHCKRIEKIADKLNQLVRHGLIILEGGWWVLK